MHFAIDGKALGILVSGGVLLGLLKYYVFASFSSPSLAFSRLNDLKFPSWKSRLASLPFKLHLAALLSLMLAFIDPHLLLPLSNESSLPIQDIATEGVAIYLVLDQSGSMAQAVLASPKGGPKKQIPKIDLLKQVTQQFILDHPFDLIGLVSFARVPRVLVPLTLDRDTLLKTLAQLQVVQDPEQDGTGMGYAIFKTAHLMAATRHFAQDLPPDEKPPYTIKSLVMIVVTDGFQDPSRLDYGNRLRTIELDDAATYAHSQGIHLYVINIDPALATAQYAPQRRQLQAITAKTGGQFYLVGDNQELKEIYAKINQLEKGKIVQKARLQITDAKMASRHFSFYPFFLSIGLGCLLAALLLETIVLKPIP